MVERTALKARRQQGARIRHVPSQSGPKRGTVWLWLVVAGRCWLQLYHGNELVIFLAVPSSETDEVKSCLWIDGVVEGSMLVVE